MIGCIDSSKILYRDIIGRLLIQLTSLGTKFLKKASLSLANPRVRKRRKQRQLVDVGWLQLNEEYLHSSITFIQMFQSDKLSDANVTSLVIQHRTSDLISENGSVLWGIWRQQWLCLCVQIRERPISDNTLTQRTNYLGVWDLVLTVKPVMAGVRNVKIVR